MKLPFKSHDSSQPAAIEPPLDLFQVDPGDQLEQVHIGSADLLFPQVTGWIIDHEESADVAIGAGVQDLPGGFFRIDLFHCLSLDP